MQTPTFPPSELRQKALVFLLGCLAVLAAAETGLRLYGFAVARQQLRRNVAAAAGAGAIRIMCIGESVTFGGYPKALQALLDKARPGEFKVFDAAIVGNNSSATLASLEKDLSTYAPQVVIAMLGCNDNSPGMIMQTPLYRSVPGRLLKWSRTYRFMHYLYRLMLEHIIPADADKKAAPQQNVPLTFERELAQVDKRLLMDAITSALLSGNFGQAEELAQKGLAADKNDPQLWMQLGGIYLNTMRLELAETHLLKAAELDPKLYEVFYRLSELYAEHSLTPEKAGKFIDRAQALRPNDAKPYYLRARMMLRTGDLPGALAALKLAIARAPQDTNLWNILGNTQRDSGRTDDAISSFRTVLKLKPGDPDAYKSLGEIYTIQKRDSAAFIKLCLELIKRKDASPDACAVLANFAKDIKLLFLSENLFKKALSVSPKDVELNIAMGQFYLNMRNNPQLARQHFLRALETDPSNARARGGLRLALERLGQRSAPDALSRDEMAPKILVENYRAVKKLLDARAIPLFAMQYPLRPVAALKDIFDDDGAGVFFVSNENFSRLVAQNGYARYFNDMFAGDFGHCSHEGEMLMAENAARAVLAAFPRKAK